MTDISITSLIPFIITAFGALLVLIGIAVKRSIHFTFVITQISLIGAFISLFILPGIAPQLAGRLLKLDGFSLFYMALLIFGGIIVSILAFRHKNSTNSQSEEYYVLLLLAVLGGQVMVASTHFISLFLGIEVLSASLFVLIAYEKTQKKGLEAAIKYLAMAATSTAFLLFGLAFLYFETGSMEFGGVAAAIIEGPGLLFWAGMAFILVAVGFKLALIPFQFWAPDVYQGAPTPTAALIASVSKAAVFGFFLRFVSHLDVFSQPEMLMVVGILAAFSMIFGNVFALLQKNIKRILAYSSIAHLGYLMVAFLAGNPFGKEAATFYLTAYFLTILGAFTVVSILSGADDKSENIEHYAGLFWRNPGLAAVFSFMMLSLAGIPLTAGFTGKFFVLMAGVDANLWWLSFILVLGSIIGLFYYLRVIVVMFSKESEPLNKTTSYDLPYSQYIILPVLSILILIIGIFPSLMLEILGLI